MEKKKIEILIDLFVDEKLHPEKEQNISELVRQFLFLRRKQSALIKKIQSDKARLTDIEAHAEALQIKIDNAKTTSSSACSEPDKE